MHAKSRVRFTAFLTTAGVLLPLLGQTAPAAARDLLVFAAASTAEALNAAIVRYDAGRSRIRASYGSSGALARQIEKGAPADLYISANMSWIDWSEKRKLLEPGTAVPLFGNRLVLIAPAASPATLRIAEGFPLRAALADSRLAIADPAHVPAGIYARAALQRLKVWDTVADRTARTADVRAALALVERGETPYGIVYRTDAMVSKKVRIVDTFPEETHPPIVYSLAVVAGRNSDEAGRFYRFLRSPATASIYTSLGFQPGR